MKMRPEHQSSCLVVEDGADPNWTASAKRLVLANCATVEIVANEYHQWTSSCSNI